MALLADGSTDNPKLPSESYHANDGAASGAWALLEAQDNEIV